MIELGKIDIIIKVLLLSYHKALPREGQLVVVVHVMAHVGQKYNSILVIGQNFTGMPRSQYP